MAIIRSRELKGLPEKDRQEKLKELKLELIKANVAANKSGKIRIREIRRTIAKLLMLMAEKPRENTKQ